MQNKIFKPFLFMLFPLMFSSQMLGYGSTECHIDEVQGGVNQVGSDYQVNYFVLKYGEEKIADNLDAVNARSHRRISNEMTDKLILLTEQKNCSFKKIKCTEVAKDDDVGYHQYMLIGQISSGSKIILSFEKDKHDNDAKKLVSKVIRFHERLKEAGICD